MTDAELSPPILPCLLGSDDVADLVRLTQEVARTSGVDGRPRFHPDPEGINGEVLGPLLRGQMGHGLDQPGWRRVWGYCLEGKLVAQIELRGATVRTGLHRAYLGMSIDPVLQGRGVGRKLLSHIIDWARDNGLAWIDLGVFSENAPAIRLYESLGFQRTGSLEDVFRLPGGVVDDIRMSLDLRSSETASSRQPA